MKTLDLDELEDLPLCEVLKLNIGRCNGKSETIRRIIWNKFKEELKKERKIDEYNKKILTKYKGGLWTDKRTQKLLINAVTTVIILPILLICIVGFIQAIT